MCATDTEAFRTAGCVLVVKVEVVAMVVVEVGVMVMVVVGARYMCGFVVGARYMCGVQQELTITE